ncbi:MAG: hypothetical protein QNK80_09065 [Akkermansiaceae bacterium]
MKPSHYLLLGGATVLLNSCGALKNVQQPLSSDGSFDPLSAPGSQSSQGAGSYAAPSTSSYIPGQWIETSMPNSTFFRVIPKGNATADKVLQAGVPLKYISSEGSYTRVELDSGAVGFVPEIMVIERATGSGTLVTGAVAPPLLSGDMAVPSSDPFIPPSSFPAPDAPVLPEIPTLPNTPVTPPGTSVPPITPNVPIPGSVDVPELPPVEALVPPDVSGITEPGVTD